MDHCYTHRHLPNKQATPAWHSVISLRFLEFCTFFNSQRACIFCECEIRHVTRQSLDVTRQSLDVTRQSLDVARQSLNVVCQSLNVVCQSFAVVRQPLDVVRQPLDVIRQTLDVNRQSLDVFRQSATEDRLGRRQRADSCMYVPTSQFAPSNPSTQTHT